MIEAITRQLQQTPVPPAQQAHFLYAFEKLLAAYAVPNTSALLITAEGLGDDLNLGMVEVNTDEQRTGLMLDVMCAYRANLQDGGDRQVN
jgi:hypothetical protein